MFTFRKYFIIMFCRSEWNFIDFLQTLLCRGCRGTDAGDFINDSGDNGDGVGDGNIDGDGVGDDGDRNGNNFIYM